ncbi:MAG: HAD hydrolase family protein [Phycisphaerales bacterium]|nr:HAD hydrolase family protein [Phycisphaerales bacterium]
MNLRLTPHPARRFDAIISDIDGCLGPESHAPLDASSLLTLARHNARAVSTGDVPLITLCSGRPQPYAEAMCRLLGNTLLPCVCENGVWLYDPRDNAFLRDPTITAHHLDAVRDATRWFEADLIPRGVVIQPGKTASISLWHPDTAFLLSLREPIRERFTRESWPLRVSNTVAWINCDLTHVNKGTGIDRLLAMTGLTRERAAGIGDMPGDLAIRERVAFFASPVNAEASVKAASDYISPYEEIEGVLDIVARLSLPPASV